MAILMRAMLAAAMLAWLVPHAEAQMLPRGSYQRTCPEASVYHGRLTAVCRRSDGSFRQSSLADVGRCVGDIGTVDGRLRCHYGLGGPKPGGPMPGGPMPGGPGRPARPLPGGSYQQSCSNIGLSGNALVATCKTMKGRQQRTSLANVDRCIGDIGNNNGRLTCNMR